MGEKMKGAQDVPGLKKMLVKKFGTLAAAWKNALDLDGNGRLSFGEFCEACRRLGFQGHLKEIWHELHGEQTSIVGTFVYFHQIVGEEADRELKQFRTFLNEK